MSFSFAILKNETEEDIAINVNEFLLPILKKLKIKGVSSKYVNLLHHHLEELTSSFGHKIIEKSIKLTEKKFLVIGFKCLYFL